MTTDATQLQSGDVRGKACIRGNECEPAAHRSADSFFRRSDASRDSFSASQASYASSDLDAASRLAAWHGMWWA